MAQSSANQTLRRLTVIVGIQWMGATLGLPLLPLFLERRGGTPSEVGLVMASFFVAGIATQFAFGHLADKFGRRRLLVVSLVIYGLASMTYLLPMSAHRGSPSRAWSRARPRAQSKSPPCRPSRRSFPKRSAVAPSRGSSPPSSSGSPSDRSSGAVATVQRSRLGLLRRGRREPPRGGRRGASRPG